MIQDETKITQYCKIPTTAPPPPPSQISETHCTSDKQPLLSATPLPA